MAKPANPLFTSFLQAHKSCKAKCQVNKCVEPGCSLTLPRDKAIGIKCELCDAFGATSKKPELVVIYNSGNVNSWFVIEMKSRPQHARDILAQLQAGVDAIKNHRCFSFDPAPSNLRVFLLHSEGLHDDDLRILRQKRFSYAGNHKISILIKQCGTNFDELVNTARLS